MTKEKIEMSADVCMYGVGGGEVSQEQEIGWFYNISFLGEP